MEEKRLRVERRCAPRHRVALPVRFAGGTGVTRDVGSAGLYFITLFPFDDGQPVWLKVVLEHAAVDQQAELTCRGTVCRVEHLGPDQDGAERLGVGVDAEAFGFDGSWTAISAV